MAKTKKRVGDYTKTLTCTDCDWKFLPTNAFDVPPENVCPECGGKTKVTTGRFVFQETEHFFGWFSSVKIVDFIKKKQE